MKRSWLGLAHLGMVWVFWGGTYLAIRFAVREGSGFPPFLMAGSRFLVAGLILLAWAALAGDRLRLTKREVLLLGIFSVFLLNGGNGLVTWAEQRAHSGYAALIVGSTPIWSAVIESWLRKKRPSGLLVAALVTGFAGLAVLTGPVIAAGGRADVWATFALVLAPLSWSIGSAVQQRNPSGLSPRTASGYQQLMSCIGFALLAWLHREPWPQPSADAWMGWGFLVLFGSVVAFTSFVSALRLLPMPLVMTYAYVNPVIAVLLGWWLLDESVTGWTVAGTGLILLGVAGVFRDRFAPAREN